MRLDFEQIDALPRLAWCARMSRGSDVVEVRHGPGVETWEDGFCEGTWDGPFDEAGFDGAVTFTGTGGRVQGSGASFASGSALGEHLCLLRHGRELFVSNSAVFAMVAAGDEPSRGYPYCEHHYFRQTREGLYTRHRRLPTRRSAVVFHECANLAVTASLQVERMEKPAPPAPRDFKEYVGLLDDAIGAVFGNAADPARRAQRYRPLATISKGYDSPALAVLVRRHGCRSAATFLAPGTAGADDGSEIAGLLGFAVRCYPTDFVRPERPFHEAEFCVCPHGTRRAWLAGEDDLRGALLVSGESGDAMLRTNGPAQPELRRSPRTSGMAGTVGEFRLRVGLSILKPWFAGWQHAGAVHRITRSPEMRPWSVGGDYDRPIARRILEEAGVPRNRFGVTKMAAFTAAILKPDDLCERSRCDYADFVRSRGVPLQLALRSRLFAGIDARLSQRSRWQLRRRLPARWRLPPDEGYLFHWGFEHTQRRYRVG